jgi:MFS family permease
MVLEGGLMGWTSVYLNQSLHASESLSGAGLAFFSGAMAFGRLFSDRLAAHYGALRLVRAGAVACAVSLLAATCLNVLPVALAAFAVCGLGLAAVAPVIFSAAGRVGGDAVALVTGMGAIGGLVGPLLLGRVASMLSLNWVLLTLGLVSAVIAWQAKVLGESESTAAPLSEPMRS